MKNCKKVEKPQFWPIWSARIEAELRDWPPLNFASNEGKVFFGNFLYLFLWKASREFLNSMDGLTLKDYWGSVSVS